MIKTESMVFLQKQFGLVVKAPATLLYMFISKERIHGRFLPANDDFQQPYSFDGIRKVMGAGNALFLSPSWTWSLNDKTDANFYRIKFVRFPLLDEQNDVYVKSIGCVLDAGPSLRKIGKSEHLAQPCECDVFPHTSKYMEKEAECTNSGFILFLDALRMWFTPLSNIKHPRRANF